ncbi:MarR family winged helix-turn-helix transcriptional regulator [Streptomyces incarnatus]|uniref:MarR family winged helix-turn-helix transcriptional regulator n=1 Tax=unclassified Streptomyces TaxID=2593676 RepID=UPI0011AAECAD|nr:MULTISPECIES: MarR family transcriptional regulator [Streptomyces]QHC33099.1 MarR family transcriptional regulator [Streptomyces sp. HF10]WKE73614.1 MarR family transcriptional regulator [Streptomyces sp. WP-1]
MTRLDDSGGDRVEGPDVRANAVAREIADAVESLTNLWSLAAQEAALRLSLHQLRALRALDAAPGLNLTALAERLDIGLPTASRLCDRLEAAGLLDRALHPEKRREVRLRLTVSGRRVLDDVAERRTQALAIALAAMEPAERSALSCGMKALLVALSSTPSSPGGAPDAG